MTNIYQPRRRGGFTLIELLVVIAIIAVLVSLTAAGVMRVYGVGPRIQTQNDIRKMEEGLKTGYPGQGRGFPTLGYYPSKLILFENINSYRLAPPAGATYTQAQVTNSAKALMAMFGSALFRGNIQVDWNNDGTVPASPTAVDTPFILEGNQVLVFYLGGIQTTNPNGCLGFNATPGVPDFNNHSGTATTGRPANVSVLGPYFDFKGIRLVAGANGFFSYNDPYGTPYAFFGTGPGGQNYSVGDCASMPLKPPKPGKPASGPPVPYFTAPGAWLNPSTFQIISAGPDGWWYDSVNNTTPSLWSPTSGINDQYSGDNLSNFSKSQLSAGQ
jgi:prepilin-type N-terminal cleavage/methylation domain-containing protein